MSTYNVWASMKRRCSNPRSNSYRYYGARGIRVCERWLIYANFYADMGDHPAGKTLDRIDSDGPYEPGNCRWATPLDQASNRRERSNRRYLDIDGERMTLQQAATHLGLNINTLKTRLRRNGSHLLPH